MKKLIFFLALLLPILSNAQNFEWLRIVGDIDIDFGQWAETDKAGNIYVAGFGRGTCDFDGHTIANVNPFWFVAKYDSNGINTWVTEIPISNGFLFEMRDFKLNNKGDCYIVGDINTNGGLYGMLVKVDSAGTLLKQVTPSEATNVTNICIDANDNYYIGGVSGNSMFVRRYTPNDMAAWTINYSGTYDLYNNLLLRHTSDYGIYVSFLFKNSLIVTDHFTGGATLSATNGILDEDMAIIHYDSTGALVWAKNYDTKMPLRSMAVDTISNVPYVLAYDKNVTDNDFLLRFTSGGVLMSSQDVGTQEFTIGWSPHIRINNQQLYYIGGGLCLPFGSQSLGYFRLKRYDLNGNLNGELPRPIQIYPPLGDIAFYDDDLYLVGGTDTGTWGNQTLTSTGNSVSDFFIAKLSEDNLSVVSSISDISLSAFQVFPNPTANNLNIQTVSDTGLIIIFDITGKQISEADITEKLTVWDISNYSSGLYYLTYTLGTYSSIVKIIKQ